MSFNIYERRKELGLTLEEIAKSVHVAKSTVKKWESGHIKNMRRDKIESLAKILKVSPIKLLSDDTPEETLSDKEEVSLNDNILTQYLHFLSSTFKTDDWQHTILLQRSNKLICAKLSEKELDKILNLL